MNFREIAARLTGVSIPVFGVSWNPPEAEVVQARRVLSFLEDRRVLYVPYEVEVPQHCIDSVLEIRRFLTDEIGRLPPDSELTASLRAMRSACRRFLDEGGSHISGAYGYGGAMHACFFGEALGQMRATFGLHIGLIAARNRIDVEDDLARILPVSDDDQQDHL
ncbi:MAG: DUF6650 family protein [Longimicrobiaceae bacterium]